LVYLAQVQSLCARPLGSPTGKDRFWYTEERA
jgi:hypothetical protein